MVPPLMLLYLICSRLIDEALREVMNMKNVYLTPDLKVIVFSDVITTSTDGVTGGGGNGETPW